ncbi:MAG: phosphoenolpyruvate--protein phosphotransferase [Vicinamibacterales bacterium]
MRISGLPVSPGVAWGPAALMLQRHPAMRFGIAAAHVERELGRLDQARESSAAQLRAIRARLSQRVGADLASLFEAQLLMLDDELLVPRARRIVESDRVNAEWALDRAFDEFCAVFADVGDEYLRERRGDVADVVGRIRRNLLPAAAGGLRVLAGIAAPVVLVADELAPSIAAQIDPALVVGLALETGSRTHHSAILARSLGLPAVAGAQAVTRHISPGVLVLVDGDAGEVVIDPDPGLVEQARARRDRRAASVGAAPAGVRGPAATTDGVAVQFQANIERLEEIDGARAAGAEGIGLFRSEFLLGGRAIEAFDEEAQYRVYRDLVERMAPHPVTIRTFDIDESQTSGGGTGDLDDLVRGRDAGPSRGPLGLRAIRLSLGHRETFEVQLRALARAGRHGAVRVLLPLVSSVDELREAKSALRSATHEMAKTAGGAPAMPVGIMIEVPSAALTVDLLAAEADFFSIGTNDLIQYCLAVDRTDGRVAGLFDPLHPAILRVIRHVICLARPRGRPVALCGEMAADPGALLLLLGLGVTEFSMSPAAIPEARELVRQISMRAARRAAIRAVGLPTSRDIAAMLAARFPALATWPAGRDGRPHMEGQS